MRAINKLCNKLHKEPSSNSKNRCVYDSISHDVAGYSESYLASETFGRNIRQVGVQGS